jgi:hypothetical protein
MTDTGDARLVVTGHVDGQSVIISDEVAPWIKVAGPVVKVRMLWGRDDVPVFPDDGGVPNCKGPLPLPGGCRFSTLTIDAGATRDYHNFIVAALGDLAEPANPGFHRTPSLDFIVVLEGELTLEVDAGTERILHRGDFAVLNGIRHRWHNRGSSAATLAAVAIGAAS